MKKVFALLLSVLLLTTLLTVSAFAATPTSAQVYVTIADKDGNLALAGQSVTVTDTDSDGTLTIHDALFAAHEQFYPGGAAAGYLAETSAWGLSLVKLWGAENGGSYGYMINHASPLSLNDPIRTGDRIAAYVFTDLTNYSDAYCYFQADSLAVRAEDSFTLTLTKAGYDANWNPITLPVNGATITVDGAKTTYKTDANGQVTLSLSTLGTHTISATSPTETLVPPVCTVRVTARPVTSAHVSSTPSATPDSTQPQTGEASTLPVYSTLLLLSAAGILLTAVLGVKHKNYEK